MVKKSRFLSTNPQNDSFCLAVRSHGINSSCFYFKCVITPLFYISKEEKTTHVTGSLSHHKFHPP